MKKCVHESLISWRIRALCFGIETLQVLIKFVSQHAPVVMSFGGTVIKTEDGIALLYNDCGDHYSTALILLFRRNEIAVVSSPAQK